MKNDFRFCLISLWIVLAACMSAFARQEASLLAKGTHYRLGIPEDGMYKLSGRWLETHGIPLEQLMLGSIALHSSPPGMMPQSNKPDHLVISPLKWVGLEDGSFDPEDYILFFAYGPDKTWWDAGNEMWRVEKNIYEKDRFYTLTLNSSDASPLATSFTTEGNPENASVTYQDVFHYEQELLNYLGSGRRWLGEDLTEEGLTWRLPADINPGKVKIYTELVSTATIPAEFELGFHGISATLRTAPIQQTVYGIKGQAGSVLLDNEYTAIPGKDIYIKPMTSEAIAYLDYITANIPVSFSNQETPHIIRQRPGQDAWYNITEADDMVIWKVNENGKEGPCEPLEINNATYLPLEAGEVAILYAKEELPEPIFLKAFPARNIRLASAPNLLIITHPLWQQEAERLADFRRSHDNLSVEVVSTENIYDELNGGHKDPTAIRAYIRYLKSKGNLRYVLLFGDASYDYRGLSGETTDFVPSYASRQSLHDVFSYTSDDYYALPDGEALWPEEGQAAQLDYPLDVAIGRLPVSTPEEAGRMVDKLISYASESTGLGNWRNRIWFVADDGDDNKHQLRSHILANGLEEDFPLLNTDRLFVDAFPQVKADVGTISPQGKDALNRAIQEGALFIDYIGHGGETGWTDERILTTQQIEALSNTHRLPIVISPTCEFGRFDDPYRRSAAELALLKPAGGVIGILTTTRPVFSATNFAVSYAFYEALKQSSSKHPLRLGDLHLSTKNNSQAGVINRNFSLLGDPSMLPAYPALEMQLTSKNGQALKATDTIAPLQEINLEGYIFDKADTATGFNGIATVSVYSAPDTLQTLGAQGPASVMQYTNYNSLLFNGEVTVQQGKFKAAFIAPKNLRPDVLPGKVSLYAQNDTTNVDAGGYYTGILTGGTPQPTREDRNAPLIELYLEHPYFKNGGSVTADPTVLVRLSDPSGINTNPADGHGLQLRIDNSPTLAADKFYVADRDTYRSGWVRLPLFDLEEGSHTLHFAASDTYLNRDSASIRFVVSDYGNVLLQEVVPYPNPATDLINFAVYLGNPSGGYVLHLNIFSAQGEKIADFEQVFPAGAGTRQILTWAFGNNRPDLRSGLYFYNISLIPTQGVGRQQMKNGKIIIMK